MVTGADFALFASPGPGMWQIDMTHVPRPVDALPPGALPGPLARGLHSTTSRYGWLLDYLEAGVGTIEATKLIPRALGQQRAGRERDRPPPSAANGSV